MSRTALPEFIVGTIALYIFQCLWFIVVEIQQIALSPWYKTIVDTSSVAYNSLLISSAMAVMIIALFGLIGAYCYGIVAEKILFWILDKRRKES